MSPFLLAFLVMLVAFLAITLAAAVRSLWHACTLRAVRRLQASGRSASRLPPTVSCFLA